MAATAEDADGRGGFGTAAEEKGARDRGVQGATELARALGAEKMAADAYGSGAIGREEGSAVLPFNQAWAATRSVNPLNSAEAKPATEA